MSTQNRRERLRNDGYAFHSEFKIGDDLIAEFYTKDGQVLHWFPEEHPYELSGGAWKKAAALNEYKRLRKEMEESKGELSVWEKWRSINWTYLVQRPDSHEDVVRFTYYQRTRVAVKRDALTNHFDEAMDHVERFLDADEHPERLRIFAETGPYLFFGEPGDGGKLEREYGVPS